MATTPRLAKAFTQVNTADAAVAFPGTSVQSDGQLTGLRDSSGHVVVWEDDSRTNNPVGHAIVGQLYNSLGNKVGGEVRISPFTDGYQREPAITTLTNGNIAIAFTDLHGDDFDIYVRIYNSSLTFVREDVIDIGAIRTTTPSITALGGGAYAISYARGNSPNLDILGRIVSATGTVGAAFDIDTRTGNQALPELTTAVPGANDPATHEVSPDVAALPGGRFVMVWTEGGQFNSDIRATIMSNDGVTVLNSDFVVTTAAGFQADARVVATADGGFIVTWEDATANIVRAQRFDTDGVKIGLEFTVKNGAAVDGSPNAAVLLDGRIAYALGDAQPGDVSDVQTAIFDPAPHRNDFNGDLLLQNVNNGAVRFLLRDTTGNPIGFTDAQVGGKDGNPNWRIVTSGGDFNGDGKNDILWQHKNGTITQWIVDDTSFTERVQMRGGGDPNWRIIATGDFNGDTLSDIVWQHTDGGITLWLRDGSADPTSFVQFSNVGGGGVPGWHVITTGDFDADGKSDLLWQQDNTGTVTIWTMDGANFTQTGLIGGGDPNWRIKATGDFNGDGAKNDILWQHTNGAITIWERDGSANPEGFTQFSLVGGNGDPNWKVKGTSDLNDDGKSDILFQHVNGNVVAWMMDAAANVTQTGVFPNTSDAAWQLIGVA